MCRYKAVALILCLCVSSLAAEEYTLEKTLSRLIDHSTRGQIIAGQYEVSQAKFSAERIGYYVPEISLNSTLPSYSVSENYDTYYGFSDPFAFKTTNASGYGNIQLKQKVITGGDLTLQTRVDISNREYPYLDGLILTATDKRRLRNFQLNFSQPLLRASQSRSAYNAARENLDRADVQWQIDQANLKIEGIKAYFDLMIAGLDHQIAQSNSSLADYNAKWDSVKFDDGVINEEAWIESKSTRLEKKLAMYDSDASYEEKANDFSHLLDLPVDQTVELSTPPAPKMPDANRTHWYIANAEFSGETELARMKMVTAERDLHETRSSTGLNGTLNASYAIGRGTVTQVKDAGEVEDKIDTKDWRVSVDLTYPIWDGGASGAGVRSKELAYESARLEYLAAQRKAQNNMRILIKRIEINNSKMNLLKQELDLAKTKLDGAEQRFTDGMISEGALLENKVYYLEAQKKLLNTLKDSYVDITELEKTDVTE